MKINYCITVCFTLYSLGEAMKLKVRWKGLTLIPGHVQRDGNFSVASDAQVYAPILSCVSISVLRV